MKFGTLLRRLRNAKKLSQHDVADQVGVCQSTYFAWENDRSSPKATHYVRLASTFDIDLKDLIPQDIIAVVPPGNNAPEDPTLLKAQTLYEDLTASQKQLIQLQQQRIGQLEDENQQLREQISQHSAEGVIST